MKHWILFIYLFPFLDDATMFFVPKLKSFAQDPTMLDWYDVREVKLTKFNRSTFALEGTIKIIRRLDNLQCSLKLGKKMGNGYIPLPILSIDRANYCDLFNNPTFNAQFSDLFNHTTIPCACTHDPGDYTINKYLPKLPKNVPPGDYRGDFTFHRFDDMIGNIQFVVQWQEM